MRPVKVGRYTLVGRLGAGAMAEVQAARLEGAGGFSRRVAIKRIRPHLVQRPGIREMLISEGRLAAVLEHASILQVYELLDEGGEFGLVMEYADLGSLARLIEAKKKSGKPIPWPVVAAIGADVAAALSFAHQLTDTGGSPLNIVHRDVSPTNILITSSGGVKLADFGIAAARGVLARGAASEVTGKPEYSSREEALGLPTTDRADVFSLGAVLWECLTLEKVHPMGHRLAVEQGYQPPTLSALRPDVPAPVCELLERALAREPQDRPTAELMAVRLRKALEPVADAFAAGGLARYLSQELQPVVPAPLEDAHALPTPVMTNAVPRGAARLTGREAELHAVLDRFSAGARVVALVGPPGMGKAALAHHLVEVRGERWATRWLVSLQDAPQPWGLALALSRALGVPLDTSSTPPQSLARLGEVFASRLGAGRGLLLLECAEAFGAALRQVVPGWLERAPGLELLVTSSERPGLGEAVQLGPLPLEAARAVLRERAFAVVEAADPALVERLVQRLDGTPLAIELAAGALAHTSVEALEAHLASGASVLPVGVAREVLGALVSRLDEAEQQALAQLSVFAGGFTPAAAAAVVTLPPGSPRLEHVLDRLLQRSLVHRLPGAESRLGLYELVRAWGLDRLEAQGLREVAMQRHAAWFVREGSRWAAAAGGRLSRSMGDTILTELQNLLRVHQRALEAFPLSPTDASNALLVALVLEPVLSLRGPHALLLSLLDSALALSATVPVHPPLLARALLSRGGLLRELGRLQDAEADLSRAFQLAEDLGDELLEANARIARAVLFTEQALYERARAELTRVEAIAAARGQQRLRAVARGQRAVIALEQGDVVQALGLSTESMTLLRELGDRRLEGIGLGHLGTLHLEQGRITEARACYQSALGLLESVNDVRSAGLIAGYLALADAFEGSLPLAIERLEEAARTLSELGELRFAALFEAALGAVQARAGRLDEAAPHLDAAARRLEERGDSVFLEAATVYRAVLARARDPRLPLPPLPAKPPRDNDVRLAWRFAQGPVKASRSAGL